MALVTDEHVIRVVAQDLASKVLAEVDKQTRRMTDSKNQAAKAALNFSTSEKKVESVVKQATIQFSSLAAQGVNSGNAMRLAATGVGFLGNALGNIAGPMGFLILAAANVAEGVLSWALASEKAKGETDSLAQSVAGLQGAYEALGLAQDSYTGKLREVLKLEAERAWLQQAQKGTSDELARKQKEHADRLAAIAALEGKRERMVSTLNEALRNMSAETASNSFVVQDQRERIAEATASLDRMRKEAEADIPVMLGLKASIQASAGQMASLAVESDEALEGIQLLAAEVKKMPGSGGLIAVTGAGDFQQAIQTINQQLDRDRMSQFEKQRADIAAWEKAQIDALNKAGEYRRRSVETENRIHAEGARQRNEIDRQEAAFKAAAAIGAAATIVGLIEQIADATGANFEVQKAIAVANATINVAEGITKAYAQGGVLGFITGALVATAGLAQIHTILKTRPGSSGGVSGSGPGAGAITAAGGGGAGAGAGGFGPMPGAGFAGAAPAAGGGGGVVNIVFKNPTDIAVVREIFEIGRKNGWAVVMSGMARQGIGRG